MASEEHSTRIPSIFSFNVLTRPETLGILAGMGMGMGMGMGRTRRSSGGRYGFTLIELVVVIGIIMILVGLIAPALGDAISQARLTRDIALVRQQALLISLYAADFEETYPYSADRPGQIFRVAGDWGLPMIESGHADSVAQLDPDSERGLEPSYMLSIAMVYSADKMRPGQVPPREQQISQVVRTHQVVFPSSKGLTFRLWDGQPGETFGGFNAFCCGSTNQTWPSPVSFADSSATSGSMRDFLGQDPLYMEHGIGAPVYSTWFGVRGRDR